MMNSLSFCLFGKGFILPSFLKNSFTSKVSLVGRFFSLSTLNIQSPLACKVSPEKSAYSFIGSLVCEELFFFLMILDSVIIKYLGKDHLGLNFCMELWASEPWNLISQPRFGKFSAIISYISFLFIFSSLLLLDLQ